MRTSTKEARIPDKLPEWLQAGWLDLDCPALERCLTVLADCIRPTVRHTCRGTFTLNRRCVLVCLLPGILPVYIVKYIACIYCQIYCQQQHVSWLPNAFSSCKSCLQAKSTDLVGMPHFLT